MATTTTNFGWDIPQSTDLVKDGATAIAALGQDIDTALVDLKGGTTGQILAKASNTDLDYSWITNDVGDITAVTAGTGISGGGASGAVTITNSMATTITTSGDTLYGTGSGTFTRLGIGSTGQVLTVAGGVPSWATTAAGGMTLISTTTLTGSTVSLSSFTGYTDLQLVVIGAYGSNQNTFRARFNSDTGSNYYVGEYANGGNGSANTSLILGDGTSSSSTNVNQRNFTVLKIQRYAQTHGKPFQVQSGYIYWSNNAVNYSYNSNSIYVGTSAITSIDLYMASGSFSGGTAYLYGVK